MPLLLFVGILSWISLSLSLSIQYEKFCRLCFSNSCNTCNHARFANHCDDFHFFPEHVFFTFVVCRLDRNVIDGFRNARVFTTVTMNEQIGKNQQMATVKEEIDKKHDLT